MIIAHALRHPNGFRLNIAILIWKQVLRPRVEYACQIWGVDLSCKWTTKLESLQSQFFRKILHLPHLSTTTIRTELGLESLQLRRYKLILRYWNSLIVRRKENVNNPPLATTVFAVSDGNRFSWKQKVKRVFDRLGLSQHWHEDKEVDETRMVDALTKWEYEQLEDHVSQPKNRDRLAIVRSIRIGPILSLAMRKPLKWPAPQTYISYAKQRDGIRARMSLVAGQVTLSGLSIPQVNVNCPLCQIRVDALVNHALAHCSQSRDLRDELRDNVNDFLGQLPATLVDDVKLSLNVNMVWQDPLFLVAGGKAWIELQLLLGKKDNVVLPVIDQLLLRYNHQLVSRVHRKMFPKN